MRILYIAYPLLTVSEESAGGAEQVLWTLEREMFRLGAKTTVAASVGSRIAGELFPTGQACSQMDDFDRRNREHQALIVEFVRRCEREGAGFDVVHDMSGSFWPRAAEIDAPMLATLHLPKDFYQPHLFENVGPNVMFNCVSLSQASSFADLCARRCNTTAAKVPLRLHSSGPAQARALIQTKGKASFSHGDGVSVVNNGIALDLYEPSPDQDQRSGLLWLGRICEEKAPHLALDIAETAGWPITLAGQIYPFSYHQDYFKREIAPRLRRMPRAKFVASPSPDAKRQLLRHAQAVIITSQAEETSSLVAMEAAASGTPVIAFARGALPEIVRHGVTGLLIEKVEDALRALREVGSIRPENCARRARECFSSATMAEGYIALYAKTTAAVSPRLRPATFTNPERAG